MRDELLNETLFFDLDQARKVIAAWVADYNTSRPHSAPNYETAGLHAALFQGSALTSVAGHPQKKMRTAQRL